MRRVPHPTRYNAQKLAKEIRNMPAEQREDRYWWMHLSPEWDQWSLSQLEELVKMTARN